MVIAVLAHIADTASAELVGRWRKHDARLLTCADLTRPGWVVRNRDSRQATAVIAGEPVSETAIAGVLVRVPGVTPAELGSIISEDREYCAAEMTAFLTWWLTGLSVPVINRPTAVSLAGPGWRPATWHLVAQRVGLASATHQWRASDQRMLYVGRPQREQDPASTSKVEVVTVVNQRPVGFFDPILADQAVLLTRVAGAAALDVAFDTASDPPRFVWADPWVDISAPAVADALLESLLADQQSGRTPR